MNHEIIINAYVLLADPTWIEASILSYYDMVTEIIVSYDENSKGWTGAYIAVDECIKRLKIIDKNSKMRYCPGHYARLDHSPMENETYQRQCALDEISNGADWVLQLDTDEVLPNPKALVSIMQYAEERGLPAIEWPMRVLFRRLPNNEFLEVCALDGKEHFEYPGPIAIRPGSRFVSARKIEGVYIRPLVIGDTQSLQIARIADPDEHRIEVTNSADAIIHNSWARSRHNVRQKMASWGHADFRIKMRVFYYTKWMPAIYFWPFIHDFHPFARGLWPALKQFDKMPKSIVREYL